jgi:pimeloyl-ACP methyl ester carboxylesterase
MNNLRTYGNAPFDVAVVHGGPGAVGEMAPVARELAARWGVLEPLQTATSLKGQVAELRAVVEEKGYLPATLIGFSWGAWLSYIVAARHPAIVTKLILVGSGPFQEKYVARIQETRLSRLSEEERAEYSSIIALLADPAGQGKSGAFARLGALASKTDTYDAIMAEPNASATLGGQDNTLHALLTEAQKMRRSGELLELATKIECPVVAIHGDYDPHPAAGVQQPLSAALSDFRFILLADCGHKPWIERRVRDAFFSVLEEELRRRWIG